MNLRQGPDELVLDYMGRYLRLSQYASGVADTEVDQVYYFAEGLRSEIRSFVMTTEPETLHRAYERSLVRERYLRTHPASASIATVQGVPEELQVGQKRKREDQLTAPSDGD